MSEANRARQARRRQFEVFFDEHHVGLSRLAYLLTGSHGVADEIAQDACEQVFVRWNEIEHADRYARTAVINGVRSWRRRLQLEGRTPGEIGPHPVAHTDVLAVRSVLAELPDAEREVLVLRFWADFKLGEIADQLDIPLGTVKSHVHRGLARVEAAWRNAEVEG